MEKIVSLCKRRGFVYPGSEIYGGLANSWDYGPLGVELKNNIKKLWWEKFVHHRNDIVGIDAALIMNPKVWEASGHLKNFSDFLSECKKCHNRVRVDHYLSQKEMQRFGKEINDASGDEKKTKKVWAAIGEAMNDTAVCPKCEKKDWTDAKPFNLMLKTTLGPTDDESDRVYFRPETAQAMFVNFKNVIETTRKQLPFGIAQIGKAFRNEITPGNFIFRTREFEQMEIEYFIREEDWEKYFDAWLNEMRSWIKDDLGIDYKNVHELDVPEGDRAHYSKRTIDFEFDFPFGRRELYGLAYRTDFDLKNHETASGSNLKYKDPKSGEEFWPHVIEPTWGVDRSFLAVLCDAYDESNKDRIVLKIRPRLAPFKAAVFPLLANKPELVKLARTIYDDLRSQFIVDWDDRGNIGKRYYSQDEIGTPYCITVDFDSLEKNDVTVRDRDTAKQERVQISKLKEFIRNKMYESR
jgi:glycyl-tRNA synthetase